MGVVIEICVKCPGGPTRMRVTDIICITADTPAGSGRADTGGRRTGGHPGGRYSYSYAIGGHI
jgi:hypothetical protein